MKGLPGDDPYDMKGISGPGPGRYWILLVISGSLINSVLWHFLQFDTRMSSLKIISCKAVIKVVGIKTYHLKILTMMITVTFNTLFPRTSAEA